MKRFVTFEEALGHLIREARRERRADPTRQRRSDMHHAYRRRRR